MREQRRIPPPSPKDSNVSSEDRGTKALELVFPAPTLSSSEAPGRQLSAAAIARGVAFGTDLGLWHRELSPLVDSIVARKVSNSSKRDDVAQEIWLRVAKSLERYDPTRSQPQSWVMLIANRTIVDLNRREKVRPVKYATDLNSSNDDATNPLETLSFRNQENSTSPQSSAMLREAFEQAWGHVKELSPDAQHCIELMYLGGLTMSQVAEARSEPVGTVKSRVSRSLRDLRTRRAA